MPDAARYWSDPERFREAARQWTLEHPEQAKATKAANYQKNREQHAAAATAWRRANPKARVGISRRNNLRQRFNLSEDEFKAMLDEQEGLCLICGEWMDLPAVDHDRDTKQVRGLLHRICNTAIAFLDHSPARIRRAIEYLQATPLAIPIVAEDPDHPGDSKVLAAFRTALRKNFGITGAEFEAMVIRQSGLCLVCDGQLDSGKGKRGVHVDHDHEADCVRNGEHSVKKGCRECIRGVLCSDCNSGMGFFGDDVALLEAAIAYLVTAAERAA